MVCRFIRSGTAPQERTFGLGRQVHYVESTFFMALRLGRLLNPDSVLVRVHDSVLVIVHEITSRFAHS